MLRKAREKAKEGLHSVQAETKRYLQSRNRHGQQIQGGGHGARSTRHQPTPHSSSGGSASISFKGVNDDFEAILNDESDFTYQFNEHDEAPGSSMEEDVPTNGGSRQIEGKFHAGDSDLFSDPLFSEPTHNPPESHANNADLLFDEPVEDPPVITLGDNHQENEFGTMKETDNTVAIPNSDNTHHTSENSVSPSDAIAVLNDSTDETLLLESGATAHKPVRPDSPLFSDDVATAHEPVRPESPLFSDDVMVGSANHMEDDKKDDSQLSARILVTQPSNESPQQSRKHRADEGSDDLFGEGQDWHAGKDTDGVGELPKPSTPDLPDIDELEQKLAVGNMSGGQDLFSSEESPFSSLASSYEGDKESLSSMATTLPHTEATTQVKPGHDENELFQEVVSAVEKEVNGHSTTTGELTTTDSQQQPATYSLEEELEMLLTPKQESKESSSASTAGESNLQSTATVDDPLQASHPLGPGPGTEAQRVSSHLDSGVFEQSGNSTTTLKSTPEKESEADTHEDDLFPIDEDHFKDDDSTPVPVRRQLIKGTSNIEVSQQSKKVLQSTISAPVIMPPGASKASSSSPSPKKNSTGKVAPPRPAISPKLKHRMIQKQSASSNTTGGQQEDFIAKKKIVQPLGQTPQMRDVRDHSPIRSEIGLDSDSISETATVPSQAPQKSSNTSPLSSKSDEKRIPADDLFLEDSAVSPSGDKVPALTGSPQSMEDKSKAVEQIGTETETGPSENEETDNYFLYHFLFAGLLYFYYSLNIFPYLSGFFAGFFVLYLTVGSVFIFYVQTVEKYHAGDGREDRLLEPSQEFTEHMHVDFDNLRVYKSNKFTATLTYDPATHHPSQRMKTVVHLINDFELYVKVYDPHAHHAHGLGALIDVKTDIRQCKLALVPDEVAKNRKRRWSKKFPIMIFNPPPNTYRVYLFSPHARDKEDWYRRLKLANSGFNSNQAIRKARGFFGYMEGYFPSETFPAHTSSTNSRSSSATKRNSKHVHPRKSSLTRVKYSVNPENEDVNKNEDLDSVSFKKSPKLQQAQKQVSTASQSSVRSYGSDSSIGEHQLSHTRTVSSSVDSEFEIISHPPKLTRSSQLQWLNAVAARLCWDLWHEQRWKDWVTTRIQKKLIRVKTPSFMEQLRVTDVDLGNDMPVVLRLREGPKLDLKGIWVYLDVVYSGKFVMTIETKMKLGKESHSEEPEERQMTTITKNKESGLPQGAPHRGPGSSRSSGKAMTHQHAARALGSSVDPYEQEIDSGSDDEESATGIAMEVEAASAIQSQEHHDQSVHLPGGRREKIKSMVYKISKKVANTKIVQRAAQKVSSYPLVLTVEVKGLEGVLAVNIPPPPTDTVWYGFKGPPNLTLVAKPKLGNREVKLSRVTHWIERKLQELVNKKLVLPEMEDIVIPILNSGIPEDRQKPISTDSAPSTT